MLRIPGDPNTSAVAGPALAGRVLPPPLVEEEDGDPAALPPPGAHGLGRGSLFSVPCCWLVEESFEREEKKFITFTEQIIWRLLKNGQIICISHMITFIHTYFAAHIKGLRLKLVMSMKPPFQLQ